MQKKNIFNLQSINTRAIGRYGKLLTFKYTWYNKTRRIMCMVNRLFFVRIPPVLFTMTSSPAIELRVYHFLDSLLHVIEIYPQCVNCISLGIKCVRRYMGGKIIVVGVIISTSISTITISITHIIGSSRRIFLFVFMVSQGPSYVQCIKYTLL